MSAPLFKIDLGPTIGLDFVGLILSAVFYGITTLQTLFYYRTYSKDRVLLKTLVGVIWRVDRIQLDRDGVDQMKSCRVLDTLSLALTAHGVYTYLVTNYANPAAIAGIEWSIASEPMVTSVIAFIVTQFLIYRIYALNRSWWPFAIVLSVITFFPLSIGIVTTYTINSGIQLLDAIPELHWMAIAGTAGASGLDLTIAFSICYSLYRSRTGFGPTEKVVNQLTIYIICSGLLTTTINMLTLITYLAASKTLLFQMFGMLGSKAYANTFMATLNTRQSIRGMATETVAGTSINSNMMQFKTPNGPLSTGTTAASRPDGHREFDVPLTKLTHQSSFETHKGLQIQQHTSQVITSEA